MTEHELTRGNEIENEISNLEYALSDVTKNHLFRSDEIGCGVSRKASSFLSELNVNVRKMAVDAINSRITELRKEFVQL